MSEHRAGAASDRRAPPSADAGGSPADLPATALRGVGARHREHLDRLGIGSVADLLRHYPARWVDRRTLRTLGSLTVLDAEVMEIGEDGRPRKAEVTVLGQVMGTRVQGPPRVRGRRRGPPSRLVVVIRDGSGSGHLVFFGGDWRRGHFEEGAQVLVSGPLSEYRGALQFQNPEYEILSDEEETFVQGGGLVPVYPLTRGLTQRMVRTWVREALERVGEADLELLPAEMRQRYRLPGALEALRGYHFPAKPEERDDARRRLAFEELYLDQLFMAVVRARRDRGRPGRPLVVDGPLARRVKAGLPFTLTADQESALGEILDDLRGRRPMNRLLQGDVGSGKTVVALLAAAAAADTGLQTAFMAPTEILAEQHFRTLSALAAPFGLEPRLLTGSATGARRREVLRVIADGSCRIAVGTHALFQEEVRFHDLGLVVMDEQHRFGVLQRLALWEKGQAPHVLVMSATPIPRTLAMVRYADLDVSVIRHRPAGRGRVVTRLTVESKRDAVYAFLAERLAEGRQAFIVYPLVEESEKSDLKAATTMAEALAAHPKLGPYGVELLHGQMKSEDKDAVMKRFLDRKARVLVATTVIEVGIDVPNASFLIIEHPERYGLSQLHQLRGRIGRGEHDSYCVLIAGDRLDDGAVERLRMFARTDDGFELARLDLALRGPGELLGTRQSGRPGYRVADPVHDERMLEEARARAVETLETGALDGQAGPEWAPLAARVRAWLAAIGDVADVG